MTTVNPNSGNETKSDIFYGKNSSLTPKIFKHFNDFQN